MNKHLNPPAPATTGAELFTVAFADGLLNPELARYVAKAIAKIAAGLSTHGVAMLADPPRAGTREHKAIEAICARMGLAPALRAAERIIDGEDEGTRHHWFAAPGYYGSAYRWVCRKCGRDTMRQPDEYELACPAEAIVDAVRGDLVSVIDYDPAADAPGVNDEGEA
jgi:hypothetical protein